MRDFFPRMVTIINFEGVLEDDSRDAVNKTYCFRGPTDFARILPLSSIEAVNLDNNHTLDYGKRGKTSTVEALTGAGVHVFDELTPYIFEKDGIKISTFFGMQRVHFFSLREQLKEQIRILREEEGVNAIIFPSTPARSIPPSTPTRRSIWPISSSTWARISSRAAIRMWCREWRSTMAATSSTAWATSASAAT